MADWKRLAKAALVARGEIGPEAAAAVRAEFLTDARVDREEVEFLLDLRRSARSAVPEFHEFVFHVVKRVVLPDGEITPMETIWLRKLVFADGATDAHERRLLKELKEAAIVTCPEFDELVHEHESI